MDKPQIISFIETQLGEGKITKNDLQNILGASVSTEPAGSAVRERTTRENTKDLTTTFYGIGATIAVIGVGILLAEHWNEIGFAGRVLSTLGISLATYICALLLRAPHQSKIANVLFMISAGLAPTGVVVMLHEAGTKFTWDVQIMVAIILALIYGVALLISKRSILFIITIAFGTWAYYALLFNIISTLHSSEILKWATMILGVAYLFLASAYRHFSKNEDEGEKTQIAEVMNTLAGLAILGAGISIGGFFDVIYIAFIFAAFYGSVYLKSRSMLLLGSLFLMGHITKLTYKYFVHSIGWPIALIAIGFLIIGVGYFTFYLNKKYFGVK
jgi:hypothetical protein